jgi:hypothetical protein
MEEVMFNNFYVTEAKKKAYFVRIRNLKIYFAVLKQRLFLATIYSQSAPEMCPECGEELKRQAQC